MNFNGTPATLGSRSGVRQTRARTFRSGYLVFPLTLASLVSGCNRPLREYAADAIGLPTSRLDVRAHGPTYRKWRYELADGEWVYAETAGESCELHFIINSQNVIIGYKVLGDRCGLR